MIKEQHFYNVASQKKKSFAAPLAPKGSPVYGVHAVLSLLKNTRRPLGQLWILKDVLKHYQGSFERAIKIGQKNDISVLFKTRDEIDAVLMEEGRIPVHQGVVWWGPLMVLPDLDVFLEQAAFKEGCLLVLDDPQDVRNVGAALRSCSAFGIKGVLLTQRKAAALSQPVLAKVSVGAFETVPLITVNNIRMSLEKLKTHDFWCYGLDGEVKARDIFTYDFPRKTVFVAGAEDKGLRPLTREVCDGLCRIPTYASMESLNVSAAISVAFYEFIRQRSVRA